MTDARHGAGLARQLEPATVPAPSASAGARPPAISLRELSVWFGAQRALYDVSMDIGARLVTALIGPSGCGKSALLRCLNRMNDLTDRVRVSGHVWLGGLDVYAPSTDVSDVRRRVGMVFQKSNPFPKSVYENVVYGPRVAGVRQRAALDETCERSLRVAGLWDEVKDRLRDSALGLSGGQMQRLCIARALAVEPDVLLMDEPCSALDPIATQRIEELIFSLKDRLTVVIVTHNLQQAARVSDRTAFFWQGRLVEEGRTSDIFTNPSQRPTEDYITGRFG